jgi:hypothetical protein
MRTKNYAVKISVALFHSTNSKYRFAEAFKQLSKTFSSACQTIERGAFSGLVNLQELLLNGNTLIEPFDLSLVFDPELVNLRAVDFAGLKTRRGYIWESNPFHDMTFNLDFQKLFASFRHTVLFFLDCSRLRSGGEVINKLKEIGFIRLPDMPVNNQ